MNMKNKKLLFILLGLSLLSFLGLLLIYPRLPETIPVHFNFHGTADDYGPKSTIFPLGLLPLGMCLLFWVLPKIDPKYQNYAKHESTYSLITIAITVFMIVINWSIVGKALGADLPVNFIVPGLLGILFIILGNFLPRFRPNYFIGIRTPWTLDNEYVWKKTHKFGGIMFCIMGLILLLMPLLPFSNEFGTVFAVTLILAASLSISLYSYLVYRKSGGKNGER